MWESRGMAWVQYSSTAVIWPRCCWISRGDKTQIMKVPVCSHLAKSLLNFSSCLHKTKTYREKNLYYTSFRTMNHHRWHLAISSPRPGKENHSTWAYTITNIVKESPDQAIAQFLLLSTWICWCTQKHFTPWAVSQNLTNGNIHVRIGLSWQSWFILGLPDYRSGWQT